VNRSGAHSASSSYGIEPSIFCWAHLDRPRTFSSPLYTQSSYSRKEKSCIFALVFPLYLTDYFYAVSRGPRRPTRYSLSLSLPHALPLVHSRRLGRLLPLFNAF
jgi:hypothetical protein